MYDDWKMKNEKWKMKNEKWKMKNEKWKMKNEKWKMKNEIWNMKNTCNIVKQKIITASNIYWLRYNNVSYTMVAIWW